MGMREFVIGAIVLGAAAGYFLSAPDAPVAAIRKIPAAQRPPAAALAEVPPTVDDAGADAAWSSGQPLPAGDKMPAKPEPGDSAPANEAASDKAE